MIKTPFRIRCFFLWPKRRETAFLLLTFICIFALLVIPFGYYHGSIIRTQRQSVGTQQQKLDFSNYEKFGFTISATGSIPVSLSSSPQRRKQKTVSLPIPGQAWPLAEDYNRTASRQDMKYTILLWKHGPRMVRRFLRSYGSISKNPYSFCSVSNCAVTIDDVKGVNISDAVLIHLHRTSSPASLPPYRFPHQRWIFFTDESPFHTFLLTTKYNMKDYNGLFNWSMTYRSDSDIPVPYGRTVSITDHGSRVATNSFQQVGRPDVAQSKLLRVPDIARTKQQLVAILGSNCGGRNNRWDYVHELAKHIKVDIYGNCGQLKCPGHFTTDCPILKQYKFYLAFENSNCKEYITEKLWWNAYSKDVIPVVMGPSKEDYERLCPPGSFIHVSDFSSPKELAHYLLSLAKNDSAYNEYFRWKNHFFVSNEHGYFGSPSLHLCRICEALNRNSPPKVYNNLEEFWNIGRDCRPSYWKPPKNGS